MSHPWQMLVLASGGMRDQSSSHPKPQRDGRDVSIRDLRDDAYLELRQTGWFGEASIELLTGVLVAVSGARRVRSSYPTLEEQWDWTDDDIREAVNEFVADLAASGAVTALAVETSDGSSLEARLRVRCKSWFQDRSKATDVGAFDRKLTAALERGTSADEVASLDAPEGRAWYRPGDLTEVYYGDEGPLLAAARDVQVKRLSYTGSSRRDPLTDWRGVLDIVLAVLAVAAKAVLQPLLLRIGVRRLGVDTRDVDSLDRMTEIYAAGAGEMGDPFGQVVGLDRDPSDAWLVESRASELLAHLDEDELGTLRSFALGGIEEVQGAFGLGKSAAYTRLGRAQARVRSFFGEDSLDEFSQVVTERALSMALDRVVRTGDGGSASERIGGA